MGIKTGAKITYVCYQDVIFAAAKYLEDIKKPIYFKTLLDHIVKKLNIDERTEQCLGNIHYALSTDRRFVNVNINKQTMWAFRDWFSSNDLRKIQNKHVVQEGTKKSKEEAVVEQDLQVGNNAIDIEKSVDNV